MTGQKPIDSEFEPEPVESPSTEIVKIMQEGDPDTMLAILEKKATLVPRMNQAINTILVGCTYPEDWVKHGETMCLKSAAAERVARHFDIRFMNAKHKKEEFTDSEGNGYRYVFEGEASLGNRIIYCQGVYGTRDKFLGFKGQEWRALEDINENNIRNAAYHIFIGNGVKALLGLRGIPARRFDEMMGKMGEDAKKSTAVGYGKGTKGNTAKEDAVMQKELGELLLEIVNAGWCIEVDDKGKYSLEELLDIADPISAAKSSCAALTSFYSKKESKIVEGLDSAKSVKGKRLEIALSNAKRMWSEFQKG